MCQSEYNAADILQNKMGASVRPKHAPLHHNWTVQVCWYISPKLCDDIFFVAGNITRQRKSFPTWSLSNSRWPLGVISRAATGNLSDLKIIRLNVPSENPLTRLIGIKLRIISFENHSSFGNQRIHDIWISSHILTWKSPSMAVGINIASRKYSFPTEKQRTMMKSEWFVFSLWAISNKTRSIVLSSQKTSHPSKAQNHQQEKWRNWLMW